MLWPLESTRYPVLRNSGQQAIADEVYMVLFDSRTEITSSRDLGTKGSFYSLLRKSRSEISGESPDRRKSLTSFFFWG